MKEVLPIAVTMGEPAGIGGELSIMAWKAMQDRPLDRQACFYVLDDPARLTSLAALASQKIDIVRINAPGDTVEAFGKGLPVLPLPGAISATPGQPDAISSAQVPVSIELALSHIRAGKAAAMVTNPLHKALLKDCGFAFPGHTEFLGHLDGGTKAVMMLAAKGLRVVPVTIHDPLQNVSALLTADLLRDTAEITLKALRQDFGIEAPRLAVAGLNPHAGEDGHIGREEIDIIAPVVEELVRAGHDVRGPVPADSLFHEKARAQYDAVLCMYHDQALIPLKMLDFWGGVNVTLGLSFIRTSPDHGTAMELAGSFTARPDSFINALDMAREMAVARSVGQ